MFMVWMRDDFAFAPLVYYINFLSLSLSVAAGDLK